MPTSENPPQCNGFNVQYEKPNLRQNVLEMRAKGAAPVTCEGSPEVPSVHCCLDLHSRPPDLTTAFVDAKPFSGTGVKFNERLLEGAPDTPVVQSFAPWPTPTDPGRNAFFSVWLKLLPWDGQSVPNQRHQPPNPHPLPARIDLLLLFMYLIESRCLLFW